MRQLARQLIALVLACMLFAIVASAAAFASMSDDALVAKDPPMAMESTAANSAAASSEGTASRSAEFSSSVSNSMLAPVHSAQTGMAPPSSDADDDPVAYVLAIAVVGVSACAMGWFFHRSAQIDESEDK